MKKAFCYMFTDDFFLKKAAIFTFFIILLECCSIFSEIDNNAKIILQILAFLGFPIFEGYKIAIIRSIYNSFENFYVLPYLNLKKDFIIGLKYLLSVFYFLLPLFIVISVFGILPISNIILNLLIFAYIICLVCFLPATILIFAKTNNNWSSYNLKEIFRFISTNKKEYTKLAFLYLIFGILLDVFSNICSILNEQSLILSLIALFVFACITTYLYYVVCYILTKFINDL